MWDLEKIAEISFLVVEMNQVLVLDNGIVISRDNIGEFIRSTNDA